MARGICHFCSASIMFRAVKPFIKAVYISKRRLTGGSSKEKHFVGLKNAMSELGGVVPKWSPPVDEIMTFSVLDVEELSADQLTVLARSYFEGMPEGLAMDKTKAVSLWDRASKLGSAEATYCYAMCKLKGNGTTQDVLIAKDLLTEMSDKNPYAPADLALAKLLRQGNESIGLKPDPVLAFSHLVYAADRGLVTAQFHVANCYWVGDGVEKSETTAMFWYKAAADGGYAAARFVLGTLYYNGLAGTHEEKDHKSIGWEHYCQAADGGDPRAMFNVGLEYMLESSDLVERDLDLAVHWFGESAERKFVPAITNLGNLYRDGLVGAREDGAPDFGKALKWYQAGVTAGDATCRLLYRQVSAMMTAGASKKST